MSEGEYVSMGYYEKYDLKAVVEYLQTIKYINKFLTIPFNNYLIFNIEFFYGAKVWEV